jgi:glycoprotein endo-alpha-1,2-mannosidase
LEEEESVHTFYYLWYGNVKNDGKYLHWNHYVLAHWEERVNRIHNSTIGRYHSPPESLHSPYYPFLGPYSSRDKAVIQTHFAEFLPNSGIEVAVVSWWGRQENSRSVDSQGVSTDLLLANLLDTLDTFSGDAKLARVKVAFHLEPYHSRSIESVYEDIKYLVDKYGHYKSLYRNKEGKLLFYIYDSYHISPYDWKRLLTKDGDLSIRGSSYDGCFIGLWLHHHHGRDLFDGGFDGVYSYFASKGFSYASTPINWGNICRFARQHNMLCSISVGPGYNDEQIRPWNSHNSKDRGCAVCIY